MILEKIDLITQALIESQNDAYLAGVIDGEGHFGITTRGVRMWRTQISVSSTYLPMLKWISENYGGYINPASSTRKQKMGYKPCWNWKVTDGESITRIVDRVLPFLIIKREQALLMREYFDKPKSTPKCYVMPSEEKRRTVIKEGIDIANHNITFE